MTEIERLRREVKLLEHFLRIIDGGLATPSQERVMARMTISQLREMRDQFAFQESKHD